MPPRRRKTAKASLESQPTSKSQTPEPKTPEENPDPIQEYDPEEIKQFNMMRSAMHHNMHKYQQAHYLPPSVSQFTMPNLGNQTLKNVKTYIQHSRSKHMETFFQHEKEGERRAREKNEAKLLYEADKNRKDEILRRIATLKKQRDDSEQKKHDIFIEMKKSLTNKESQAINDCRAMENPYGIGNRDMASIVNQSVASDLILNSSNQSPNYISSPSSQTNSVSTVNMNITNMPPPRIPNPAPAMSPQYQGVIPNTLPVNSNPNSQIRKPMLGPLSGQQPSFFE